jgi:glutathione S-transferase
VNPNGFAPVIEDPNTSIKAWESSAIAEYILDAYDSNTHRLSFPPSELHNRALLHQWLAFQSTFQGTVLSNAFYFATRQPNADARTRFMDESLGVLDAELKGKEWLVGRRCTAADLVFVPYYQGLGVTMGKDALDFAKEFPNVDAWMQRMGGRASVKKVAGDRAQVLKAQAQQGNPQAKAYTGPQTST